MNKFVEMRRQLAQSALGTTLCEWLEEKAKKYCDARNLQSNEDLNSAKHVGRVLEEIIQELKIVNINNPKEPNEYA